MLAVTSASRKRITVGTLTPTTTATPEAIDLGATYSNAAGTNLKILTYNDGVSTHGIGVSTASSDYVTIATTGIHSFYTGTVRSVTMDVYGIISGTTSANRTSASTVFPNWLSSTNIGNFRNTYFEGNASTGGSNWFGAGTTPYYALDWDSTDQGRFVNNSGAWAKTHALSRNTGMENQYFNTAFVYECTPGTVLTGGSWNYINFSETGGTRQLSRNSIGYDANITFTAPMAGWYFFSAQVNFVTSTDTDGTIKLILNSNFACYGPSSSAIAIGGTLQHPGSRQVSGVLYMAGGDYVQVACFVTAASTIRSTAAYAGTFSGHFIG
jgi:hypothetical protein